MYKELIWKSAFISQARQGSIKKQYPLSISTNKETNFNSTSSEVNGESLFFIKNICMKLKYTFFRISQRLGRIYQSSSIFHIQLPSQVGGASSFIWRKTIGQCLGRQMDSQTNGQPWLSSDTWKLKVMAWPSISLLLLHFFPFPFFPSFSKVWSTIVPRQ